MRQRGYPGDAELLDYIYGSPNVRPMVEGSTVRGRRIYEFNRTAPAAAAVRHRLGMAASEVDRLARTGMRPHVLSIACGHLREADRLEALAAGTLGRLVRARSGLSFSGSGEERVGRVLSGSTGVRRESAVPSRDLELGQVRLHWASSTTSPTPPPAVSWRPR